MVDGAIPEEKHTMCEVDELPFRPWNDTSVVAMAVVDSADAALLDAWTGLVRVHAEEVP
jgi:hypothetical protein